MSETGTAPPVSPAARWWAAVVVAAVPLVVIVVTYGWWRSRLPDPLPRQWWDGAVSTTFGLSATGFTMATIATAGGLVAAVGAFTIRRWRTRRALLAVGAGIGAFGAVVWLVIAGLSLGHTDVSTVPEPSWQVLGIVMVPAAWAALGFAACPPAPSAAPAAGRPAAHLPRVDLPPGRAPTVWTETAFSGPTPVVLLMLFLGLTVVLAVGVHIWAGSLLLLMSLAVALFLLAVRVRVDHHGLRIEFGLLRFPRVTVPLREIESAEVTTVRPHEWGGAGYRIRPGGRGVILRAGPGVRLTLSDDRHLVVNSRDPENVAGLLNTLIDRQRR